MKKEYLFLIIFLMVFQKYCYADTRAVGRASVEIIGGNLSIKATDINFYPINLNLKQNSTVGENTITVKDPTGTGSGWHINAKATDLTSKKNIKIPLNQVYFILENISADRVKKIKGSNRAPKGVGHSIRLSNCEQKIIFAEKGAGMGLYEIRPRYTLTVPQKSIQGEYTSIVTYTIFQGP